MGPVYSRAPTNSSSRSAYWSMASSASSTLDHAASKDAIGRATRYRRSSLGPVPCVSAGHPFRASSAARGERRCSPSSGSATKKYSTSEQVAIPSATQGAAQRRSGCQRVARGGLEGSARTWPPTAFLASWMNIELPGSAITWLVTSTATLYLRRGCGPVQRARGARVPRTGGEARRQA